MNKNELILLLTSIYEGIELGKIIKKSDEEKEEINKQLEFMKGFKEFLNIQADFISYEDSINQYKDKLILEKEIKINKFYNKESLEKNIKEYEKREGNNIIPKEFYLNKVKYYKKILEIIEKSSEEEIKTNELNVEKAKIEKYCNLITNMLKEKTEFNDFFEKENINFRKRINIEIKNEELKNMTKIIFDYIDYTKEEIIKELKKS